MPAASSKRRGEGDVAERVASLAKELDALRVGERVLDLSYASIDHAEDRLGAILKAGDGDEIERWRRVLGYYLGATLVAHAGGRWDQGTKGVDAGRLAVTGFPGATKAVFIPEHAIMRYVSKPSFGLLRDVTERYDLPLRRREVAAMVGDATARMAALRDDVRGLIGKDPGVLDGAKASLDPVEEALRQPGARRTSRELRRRMIENVTLYLGVVVGKALRRKGEWTVCDGPTNADFGEARVFDWTPITVVRNCVPKREPGLLRGAVDDVLEEQG